MSERKPPHCFCHFRVIRDDIKETKKMSGRIQKQREKEKEKKKSKKKKITNHTNYEN